MPPVPLHCWQCFVHPVLYLVCEALTYQLIQNQELVGVLSMSWDAGVVTCGAGRWGRIAQEFDLQPWHALRPTALKDRW